MFEELKERVVLITGASTGIGAAAALAFGRLGAHVIVHYNKSEAAAKEVAAGIEAADGTASLIQGDMSDGPTAASVVEQAIEKAGRLDILINNAGHMVDRIPVEDMDDGAFDRVLDLNARSAVAAIRAALPQFRRQGKGNIINVTSISARGGGSRGSAIATTLNKSPIARGWTRRAKAAETSCSTSVDAPAVNRSARCRIPRWPRNIPCGVGP